MKVATVFRKFFLVCCTKKDKCVEKGWLIPKKDVNGEKIRKWLFIITEKTETTEGYENGFLIITEKTEKTEENENFSSFCGF